ncbi:hypothetical protein ACERZ8_01545 [Tateyamaria armeniaca]|uniref:Uncharacterized protein n=1 Tax=Tateyamaria armeniaca TaxID=2518930 RepID=A0ABW8URB6_9RHOB
MTRWRILPAGAIWCVALIGHAPFGAASAHPAIDAFTAYCFKAGQTPAQARANMTDLVGDPLPFTLTFWDKTLQPAPGTPAHAERRCEVAFDGDHAADAVTEVQAKMATPPVFGTSIPLTSPYEPNAGTAYLDARELLRKRVAVVHIGTRDGPETFIRVDRLPPGMGLSE